MKMNFDLFKYKNKCYKQLESKKVDTKNWVIYLIFMFCSYVTVFEMSKKLLFLQFYADLRKKPESVKATYMYAAEWKSFKK